MGYFEHLKDLLRPLRLYDLDSGAGRAELKAIGNALDRAYESLENLEKEAIPVSASHYGLESYEKLMPFVPAYSLVSERRAAICALMRIDGMGFTLKALNSTAAGCGIGVLIEESDKPMTVRVNIINTRGVPEDFSALQERIEQILPCHLDVEYSFIYTTWNEFMGYIDSWDELMGAIADWSAMEIYIES